MWLDAERLEFLRICSEYQGTVSCIFNGNTPHKVLKSRKISAETRKKGNELFQTNKHDSQTHASIFKYYCKSIAFAPPASEELLLAIMNRSALLLHLCKYKESLSDVEKALVLCKHNDLQKGKLLCRKLECLKKSGSTEYEPAYGEVENWVETIKNEVDKSSIISLMNKVKKMSYRYEFNSENESTKVLCDPVNKHRNIEKPVTMKFDAKHGRHLLATRDFSAGEIIFTEEFFAFILNLERKYTHCNNCRQICWSSVSCENCTWASFCSESCRTQALNEHHNIECSVIPDGSVFYEWCDMFKEMYHLWIRMLIIGIKEAGSIANLKADFEARAKLPDTDYYFGETVKHSLADVIFISTEYHSSEKGDLESRYAHILPFLIYFVKNSSFFRNHEGINDVANLLKNDDAVFLGSLLVKCVNIRKQIISDCQGYEEYVFQQPRDPKEFGPIHGKQSASLAPFMSMIGHSCYPNVDYRSFNDSGKGIVYALRPIKQGSEILASYVESFYHMAKKNRQQQLNLYTISCDCVACSRDWPELLNPYIPQEIKDHYLAVMKRDLAREAFIKSPQLFECLNLYSKQVDRECDSETFDNISKTLTLAVAELEQPSMLLCYLIETLSKAFQSIYCRLDKPFEKCEKNCK